MQDIIGQVKQILTKAESVPFSTPIAEGQFHLEGLLGDSHYGLTMLAHGHHPEYTRATEIRNTRQLTILSSEELAEVADMLGVTFMDISWLSGNLLVSGVVNFSVLPYGSRLIFEGGVVLGCARENDPCRKTASITQQQYPLVPNVARDFIKTAMHKRGIAAWVEHPGLIKPGESFRVELPAAWNQAWVTFLES